MPSFRTEVIADESGWTPHKLRFETARAMNRYRLLFFQATLAFLLTSAFFYPTSEEKPPPERAPLAVSTLPRIEVPIGLMPQMERENTAYRMTG